jgi:hypothetical protein
LIFVERHRVWSEGVPAFDVRVGLAQVLEEPFAEEVFGDDLRWWLVTVWRP